MAFGTGKVTGRMRENSKGFQKERIGYIQRMFTKIASHFSRTPDAWNSETPPSEF